MTDLFSWWVRYIKSAMSMERNTILQLWGNINVFWRSIFLSSVFSDFKHNSGLAATLSDSKWNTTQCTWSVNCQNIQTCIYLVNLKFQRWLSYINCTDCKMCYFFCSTELIFWRLTKHGHSAFDKIQRAAQISRQRAISEFTQLTTKWCLQIFFSPVIADFSFNLTFSPL